MFESVFMFVDAELNFSFFVLLGNDEFAVTVREGVDTVQDIFEQRDHWLNFKCRFRAKSINQNTRNYTVKE